MLKSKNGLKTHVFKKNIKSSSRDWLNRQMNDIYVKSAKEDGFYARSAYKLVEINEKYRLLKPNTKVIDLGAAPGSWSQVVAKTIFSKSSKGSTLICLDLLDIKPIPNASLLKGDFTDAAVQNQISEILNGEKADVILSDMAPNTTGNANVDHLRIMDLVEQTYNFAINHLAKDGSFVAKVFAGGTESQLLAKIKQSFAKVNHFKPDASRKESKEIYLVATGFRG
jgi:23S rRNA (uridine2552-2'-O)-methyltransferase